MTLLEGSLSTRMIPTPRKTINKQTRMDKVKEPEHSRKYGIDPSGMQRKASIVGVLRGVGPVLMLLIALGLSFCTQLTAQTENRKPNLYYFVVDRSGSIKTNGLVIPIRGALLQMFSRIRKSDEVRIVLFNDKADRRRVWKRMDIVAKGEFSAWFDKNFVPHGNTRLYDTVAEVLQEIARDRNAYGRIELTILSDGMEDPPISTKYRSWKDIAPLSRNLAKGKPPFFGTWYTLGFKPPDVPAPDSGIQVVEVPQPREQIPIMQPRPLRELARADFSVSAGSGWAPLTVKFLDRSQGKIIRRSWDFGDGSTSDIKNPVHTYRKSGKYVPRLTLINTDGSKSRDDGVIEITVEPIPWAWIFLAVLLIWVLVVVPITNRLITPQKGVILKSDRTHYLRDLARKHRLRWLWPRAHICIGLDPKIPDRVLVTCTAPKLLAKIHRFVGTKHYYLRSENQVFELRNETQFELGGTTFTFMAPGNRKKF